MKSYHKYFIFGTIAILVALIALWPLIAETRAKSNIYRAMEETLILVEPDRIYDDIGPISVECRDVMFFTTLCASELSFGTSDTRRDVSLRDIENYILEQVGTLKTNGWSQYEYKAEVEDYPDLKGIKYLYFIQDKTFGSVNCEVLFNYASRDSVTGESPSLDQHITCRQELGLGIF